MVNTGRTLTKVRNQLLAWHRYDAEVEVPAETLSMSQGFEQFEPDRLEDEVNHAGFRAGMRGGAYSDRFIVMPPVASRPRGLLPVVMPGFFDIGGILWVGIRVALFRFGESPTAAVGYRFEPPDVLEDGRPPTHMSHLYAHAQPISGWRRDAVGFMPTHVRGNVADDEPVSEIDEHRPAFPLRPPNPEGLVACAIVALYGSKQAEEILTSTPAHGLRVADLVRPDLAAHLR